MPEPAADQVLVKVHACGVCRTDLHVVDGELAKPKLPLVPGHEVVGEVAAVGAAVEGLQRDERVGIPWLGFTCGECAYCRAGRENLCDSARFTGYDFDGGYAEYAVVDARYCFPMPGGASDAEAAPLLCAGLIGYRSLRRAGDPKRLGIYGFGAAAHIVAQVAAYEGARCTPSPVPAIPRRRRSPASSGRCGPATPGHHRLSRWMPRSSLRRWARWFPPACAPCGPEAGWCARGFT